MQLTVDLGDRSYPIFIESDACRAENLSPFVKDKKVLIVTNSTIEPLYLKKVVNHFT